MSDNPYQAPTASVENRVVHRVDLSEAEALREEYLSHEAAVRSVGMLYYVIVILTSISVVVVAAGLIISDNMQNIVEVLSIVAVVGLIALLQYWIGNGLRTFNRSARNVGGVFAALGLLQFPLGTALNAYILYLLFSAKGKMVFSEEYKAAIEATPHIKTKTSALVWVLVAIFILSIAAMLAIPALVDSGSY